jgi:hypothetical protein
VCGWAVFFHYLGILAQRPKRSILVIQAP